MTNQLIILADDQRNDTLLYMANVVNRLQRVGTTFAMHRGNHSLCQPCRVTLFTGQNSKHHGVTDNSDAIITSSGYDHDATFAKALDNAGVYLGLIGKYLNDEDAQNPVGDGWSFWRQLVTNNQDNLAYEVWDGTTTTAPGTFVSDYLLSQVSAFLTAAGANPWCLVIAPTLPHYPFQLKPKNVHKWPWYSPILYEETHLSDRPSWVQARTTPSDSTRRDTRNYARAHLRELSSLDELVGGILDLINLTTTDVYYTTDNSVHYGEARLRATFDPPVALKNTPYDAAIRTPFVAAGPSWASGVTVNVPTTDTDVTATLHAVATATPVLANQAGTDLRAIAASPGSYTTRQLLHRGVLIGGGLPSDQPTWDGISTATRKLVRYQGETGDDEYELYALDDDPHELINRGHDGGNDPLGGTWANTKSTLDTALDVLLA